MALFFARVFGTAAARNENRPGGGSEDERDLMSHDEPARRARKRVTQSLGCALAAFGILLAAVGAASSFDEVFMNSRPGADGPQPTCERAGRPEGQRD